MRPVMTAHKGGLYCGGSAVMVERALQLEGDDILYVGDHIYTGGLSAHFIDDRSSATYCASCCTMSARGRAADFVCADAALAKLHFRWRTALIVRELEEEASALTAWHEKITHLFLYTGLCRS